MGGFAAGERVYWKIPLKKIGAFEEYVAVDSSAISKVPQYLSDEEAARIPLTALTALQSFELMKSKAGETVFISGGSGSLGAMAIPIAKSIGLTIITNGNGASMERVKKLGADIFIDYKKRRLCKNSFKYRLCVRRTWRTRTTKRVFNNEKRR